MILGDSSVLKEWNGSAEGPAAFRAAGSRTSRADPQQAGPEEQLLLKYMLQQESAYFNLKAKYFDHIACASGRVSFKFIGSLEVVMAHREAAVRTPRCDAAMGGWLGGVGWGGLLSPDSAHGRCRAWFHGAPPEFALAFAPAAVGLS